MSLNRRELCSLFPALLVPALLPTLDNSQDQSATQQLASGTFPFEKLSVKKSDSAEIRGVFKGKLVTGESLEVHETTLAPGAMPHPPHRHTHTEMWLVREGTVELTVNGAASRIGPGSVGFVRSNDEHGIKNVGSTPATYFVVAVGPGSA